MNYAVNYMLDIRELSKKLLVHVMKTGSAHCSKVIGKGGQNVPTNLKQNH